MQHSSLPNVKECKTRTLQGNLEITRSSVRYARHPPNVSRSCSPRGTRIRGEDRLTRSVGGRDQERRVFEWCKKNNVNMVRKLPRLDSTILTTRGTDMEKFITFVEEAPRSQKGPRAKPAYDPIKQSNTEEVAKSNYCQYCQREMPSNKHRRRSMSFTSPYDCEYCGASNNIDDTDDNISSTTDSEPCTSVAQTVRDTIRRGNPEHVIDHRTFHEKAEKSERKKGSDLAVDEEMDIFWRNDASEYFEAVDNADVVDEMSNLSMQDEQTVFLTETCIPVTNKRHAEVKMAWDDEGNTQLAEISRTIARDDGLHEKDVPRNEDAHSKTLGKDSSKPDMRSSVCLFQENDPASGMKVRVHGRTQHGSQSENVSVHDKIHTGPSNGENLKITKNIHDTECNTNVNQLKISNENLTIRSPIADRSVGLSRVALMRLSRAQRSQSNSPHSSGMRRKVTKIQEPLAYSSDSHQSYSFLDSVDPEIKTFKKDEEEEMP